MEIYRLDYIETPRLILRPVKSGDEIEINAAINRSLTSLQRWMPWSKDPRLETTRKFIESILASWRTENLTEFPLVVTLKGTNKIIGVSGYNQQSVPDIPFCEIGYWIDSQYEGKGLVSEYVNALTRYAFDILSAQRVQIAAQVDNIKSLGVAERCGFTRELVMKHYCLDCKSGLPADSVLYACCNSSDLPSLKVSWHHLNKLVEPNEIKFEEPPSYDPVSLKPLETKRLRLIPPKSTDTIKVHDALMASIGELAPYFSWATKINLQLEAVKSHIEEDAKASADIKAHTQLFYFVWDKVTNNFLGEVWLNILDWSVMSAYCGYWFDTRHTGKGYASEAVARLVKYAFDDLNAKRIAIDVSIENEKSLKLPRNLNFISEGIMKNYYRNFITNKHYDAERFSITDISQLKYNY